MKTYDLYLESGPKRRTTMVHVPSLLGCVATGRTTEEALSVTPDAIRAYRRFMRRHAGESTADDPAFGTRVVEHVTEGQWLGNGSPYIVFAPDLKPVTPARISTFLRRFHALREALASWAAGRAGGLTDSRARAGADAVPPPLLAPLEVRCWACGQPIYFRVDYTESGRGAA
ncbi:MAG: hypothetical protein IVW36_07170 [Dehalococcoidia bacterium]|nr:hypothetical protein [Dehalococcoidia bacterium]